MYRRYADTGSMGSAAMTSSAKTLVAVFATAAIKPYIYDWTLGTIGTPSDSVMTITIVRASTSTATYGTAGTPNPLDFQDPAATATILQAQTTESTAGVTLFQVGLNVRATYRWVAAPGGELVTAAGTGNNTGLSLRASSPAYVLDAQATVYHAE